MFKTQLFTNEVLPLTNPVRIVKRCIMRKKHANQRVRLRIWGNLTVGIDLMLHVTRYFSDDCNYWSLRKRNGLFIKPEQCKQSVNSRGQRSAFRKDYRKCRSPRPHLSLQLSYLCKQSRMPAISIGLIFSWFSRTYPSYASFSEEIILMFSFIGSVYGVVRESSAEIMAFRGFFGSCRAVLWWVDFRLKGT